MCLLGEVHNKPGIGLRSNPTTSLNRPKGKTMSQELTVDQLKRGGLYNWIGQPERLVYIRRFNGWHQFCKIGDATRAIWCEVLDEDLHMLEETK